MKETGMEAASSGSSSTVKMDLGDSGCDRTLLPGACRGFGGLRGNAAGEASGARSFEARNPTGEMEIASVVLRSMMADSGVERTAPGRHLWYSPPSPPAQSGASSCGSAASKGECLGPL